MSKCWRTISSGRLAVLQQAALFFPTMKVGDEYYQLPPTGTLGWRFCLTEWYLSLRVAELDTRFTATDWMMNKGDTPLSQQREIEATIIRDCRGLAFDLFFLPALIGAWCCLNIGRDGAAHKQILSVPFLAYALYRVFCWWAQHADLVAVPERIMRSKEDPSREFRFNSAGDILYRKADAGRIAETLSGARSESSCRRHASPTCRSWRWPATPSRVCPS